MNVRRFRLMSGSMMIFCRAHGETEIDTLDGSSTPAAVSCSVCSVDAASSLLYIEPEVLNHHVLWSRT